MTLLERAQDAARLALERIVRVPPLQRFIRRHVHSPSLGIRGDCPCVYCEANDAAGWRRHVREAWEQQTRELEDELRRER